MVSQTLLGAFFWFPEFSLRRNNAIRKYALSEYGFFLQTGTFFKNQLKVARAAGIPTIQTSKNYNFTF